MPTLQILASKPLSGKTTVAVALAQGFARDGSRVRLVRVGSGSAAEADARAFASFLFASSPGAPVPQPAPANANETLIVELDAAATQIANTPAVIALRGEPSDADQALARSLGDQLLGTIAVAVNPGAVEAAAREITNAGLRPLALLPEDSVLAAPSVAEIGATLNAEVLFTAENDDEVVEEVLIAPVYADPARPHFHRFDSKAVLSPFNKTDLHLAAIEAQAACLVITGGKKPSPYIMDRVHHGRTTLFLSAHDTPGTVNALADMWSATRFRGLGKAEAAARLLEGKLDFAALARKLS